MQWIACQIGAREHYAVPRVLHGRKELALLITDAWADKWFPWGLNSRAAERFHPDIPRDLVKGFDFGLLWFELANRRRLSGWELTMARNEWFQRSALLELKRFRDRWPGTVCTLFCYSYAAKELFQFARESGWNTVLGQMDPGPFEEAIVVNLQGGTGYANFAKPAPSTYWDNWRHECRLADRIIVNSNWSRRGLLTEGIDSDKIQVVPLAYDSPQEAASFVRQYPAAFDFSRPLRILFLGQINIRKGLTEILGAVSKLGNLPVEFWMVGDVQFPIPTEYKTHPRVRWIGAVPRGTAAQFYRDADVFLFPTHSDGFGLTQLEAQAWNLPVVASRHCGDVVQQGVNGYLLDEVSSDTIARAIESILASPATLSDMAGRSRKTEFTLAGLHTRLAQIAAEADSCCRR